MTTPAATLLKKHFPSADVTYLVEEPYRRLVEGHPAVDRVIAVPAEQRFGDFLGLIRRVRRERFDVLLDFHGGPRASWITAASGARFKIGYAIKRKGFLYDVGIPRRGPDGPIHSVRNHVNLVRAMGVDIDDAEIPPLTLPAASAEEMARVERIVKGRAFDSPLARGLDTRASKAEADPRAKPGAPAGAGVRAEAPAPGDLVDSLVKDVADVVREADIADAARDAAAAKLVVLHIGAGNRFRDWGAANAASLVRLLAGMPGVRIALIGADGDRTAEAEILRAAPAATLPLAGLLNLIEVRELIARATLYVGPDSGPMHIAASTATPLVAYFGPTLPAVFAPWRPCGAPGRPAVFAPWQPNGVPWQPGVFAPSRPPGAPGRPGGVSGRPGCVPTVVLEKSLDCRPCRQRECVTMDYRCLLTITADEVFAACRQFLL